MGHRALAIFDFNGTIQDDVPYVYAGVRGVLMRFGITPPTLEEFLRWIRPEFGPFYWDLGVPRTVTESELNAIIAEVLASEPYPHAFPDALETIRTLAQESVACAVVSGWPEPGLGRALERHGVRAHVSFVRGGVTWKASVFRECMAQAGIPSERTYVVGDTIYDAEAAHEVGAKPLICPRGFHSRERIVEAIADIPSLTIVETLAAVPAYVR